MSARRRGSPPRAAPPHLKAIAPIVSPPGNLWRNEPVYGGAFLLGMGEWLVGMGLRSWQVGEFMTIFSEQQDYFEALPLASLPERAGTTSTWWPELMKHPTFDDFWKQGSYDNWSEIAAPALNITRLVGHELPRRAAQLREHEARGRDARCARRPEARDRSVAALGQQRTAAATASTSASTRSSSSTTTSRASSTAG